MKKVLLVLLVVLSASLLGCSGKMDRVITPASEYTASSHDVFEAPYDKVWKATIDSIAESFWSLDNIEKDSGILTLSCVFTNPEDWVDCGSVHHTAKFGAQKQDVTYSLASKYERVLWANKDMWAWLDRTVALTAKSNILVKKTGKNEVTVTVNTNYVLNLTYEPVYSYFPIRRESKTMTFNNKAPGSFGVADSMICKSKNTLEQAILKGIAQKLK